MLVLISVLLSSTRENTAATMRVSKCYDRNASSGHSAIINGLSNSSCAAPHRAHLANVLW